MRYPWQHDDWQRLATAFSRLPNAWLFTGPAGIGILLGSGLYIATHQRKASRR